MFYLAEMVPALVFLGFYHLVSFFMMPVLLSIDMHVFVFKIVEFILNNQDFSTNFFGFLFNLSQLVLSSASPLC